MSKLLKVGITCGDLNGIGLEVILKALKDKIIFKHITPIVYASGRTADYYKELMDESIEIVSISDVKKAKADQINVVNCWNDNLSITPGKADVNLAKFPVLALQQAVNDEKAGFIDYIVTGPVDKHQLKNANFGFPGHTEFFGKEYDGAPLMLLVKDKLRVAVVTGHIPLSMVAEQITKENVTKTLERLYKTLQQDFGILKPVIAVLGLNPHAGDNGVIGSEEEEIIRPVIISAKKKGQLVLGPFPADGFFASGNYAKYDGILAMYHDQGLTPFKTIAETGGVNFTAGLSLIRTSPDHGTAYDIAGKNKADYRSMVEAIFQGKDILNFRKEYQENEANKVKKMPKLSEKDV